MGLKKLLFALAVVGPIVGTSLTTLADEDHRDRDPNDESI
jgi:hypothetical protein